MLVALLLEGLKGLDGVVNLVVSVLALVGATLLGSAIWAVHELRSEKPGSRLRAAIAQFVFAGTLLIVLTAAVLLLLK
jgi:hypothetical protein